MPRRAIDEIQADLNSIIDTADAEDRNLTDEETTRFTELENELQASRRSEAIRTRNAGYNTVVTPAGVPSPSPQPEETIDNAFRDYLRTGRPNADLEQLRPANAQSTTTTGGGYTVPQGFLDRLVEVIKSFGGVLRNVETLSTDTGNPLTFPTIDDTGNSAVIAAENTAPGSAGADLTFGQVPLGAYEYNATGAGNTPLAVPRALAQDSATDIEALVIRKLGERIGRKMAVDAVNGTGSSQPQGLLQGITGLELAASTGVAYGDLVDLMMTLDEAYWENGKWYMNRASFGTVMKLKDGDNSTIFRQGVTLDNGSRQVGSIAVGGILAPVVLDSAMPNITLTNGAGINWAVFGDISEGYIWRMVRDVEVLVDPYTANDKRQIKYNAWARADGHQKNTTAYKALAGWTT